LIAELDGLRPTLGTTSRTSTIRALVKLANKNDGRVPATPQNLFADSRPCLVVGPSGSGKTTSIKNALPSWTGNVLVLDVSNEYPDLVKVPDSRDIDWQGGSRVRIVPSGEAKYSQIEGAYLFRDLARQRSTGVLRSWLICVEEAHRFLRDPNLKDLVLEARKFIGKLVIATADPGPLIDVMPAFSPLPIA
jgi:DNA helicase HerA-like ATPase